MNSQQTRQVSRLPIDRRQVLTGMAPPASRTSRGSAARSRRAARRARCGCGASPAPMAASLSPP